MHYVLVVLDPSDTDLCHSLANMIAVVFALPSHSNHIWYHMFNPGELEKTHLTGFMVISWSKFVYGLLIKIRLLFINVVS